MARLATIDLDWLNDLIDTKMRSLNSPSITTDGVSFIMKVVPILRDIRSKCIPIEVEENKTRKFPEPLPKYCKVKDKEYCFLHDQCQECTDNNNIK
jgi:hypothetical protein